MYGAGLCLVSIFRIELCNIQLWWLWVGSEGTVIVTFLIHVLRQSNQILYVT